MEDSFVHHGEVLAHPKVKTSLPKNVALQIEAGCDFDDGQAFRLKTQHTAFSDIQDPLFKLSCSPAAEGHVFDFRNKFLVFAFFGDS